MKRITGLAAAALAGLSGALYAQEIGEAIANACAGETNLPGAICECVGERAADELSEPGQLYLLALITGDKAQAAAVQPSVPTDEVIAAGLFMVTVPQECAG